MTFEKEVKKIEWMRISFLSFYVGAVACEILAYLFNLTPSVGFILLAGGVGMCYIYSYTRHNIKKKFGVAD